MNPKLSKEEKDVEFLLVLIEMEMRQIVNMKAIEKLMDKLK